jgi:hypothetical protein
MAIQGSAIDFPNLGESINAQQRNPQLRRLIGNGSVTASVIQAVIVPTGTAVITDTTVAYTIAAPGLVFPFGAPLAPTYGLNVGSVSMSSAAACTLIYHI